MSSSDVPKELKPNKVDYGVAVMRGTFDLIPYLGPTIAEFIGTIIPNQRIDRLAKFTADLDRKLERLRRTLSDAPFDNEEFADLFEEACRQAARSTSDERRSYIATLVANGLNSDEIEYAESKHLLRILGELSDVEVIWLCSYRTHSFGGDEEFREKHKAIFTPVQAGIGSPPEAYEKYALRESYREHLSQLGLLNAQFRTDEKKDMPKFDRITGAMEVSYYRLSGLGRLLLKEIGLGEDE